MNVIEWRRYFHRKPELSFKEFETTQQISLALLKMNIPHFIPKEPPCVGVIGWIDGRDMGKTVALRADIDALPIREKTKLPFASENENMHACGHDAHIAMLLCAASELEKMKTSFRGRIYLIFQPAEEIGLGSRYLMRQGEWFNQTDSVFGMHIWTPLAKGKISVEEGARMAGADRFSIKVTGRSGHSGEPNQTIDPIVCASAMVSNLQTVVSRNTSPSDPLALSVCSIHSGTSFNVIPETATLEGTTRYYSNDIKNGIENHIKRIAEGTAITYGAKAEVDFEHILDPLINSPNASETALKAAKKIFPKDFIVKMKPTAVSEDFSFYAEKKPSCFAFLGTGSKECKFPHHSENFLIDESVLQLGVRMHIEYALAFLL